MRTSLCPLVVGRDEELDLLARALGDAGAGRGSAVFLTGEAGIGKSRLAREVADRARREGFAVCTGRAVAGAAASPFRPLTEALLGALRGAGAVDHPSLAPFAGALARVIPGWAPGGADGGESAVVLGEAVLRLLRVLARGRAALVVLEDLHWCDDDTLAVVEYVADNVAREPVLLVGTTRPEPPDGAVALAGTLRRRGAASVFGLERLDEDATTAMAAACLGRDVPPGVREALATHAEGLPFFVEELLAVMDDDGSFAVPTTFAASVHRRLAALDANARRVVDAAAVLGRTFDWTLLGPIVGLDDVAVVGALRTAREMQLLGDDGEGEEGDAFRFRHALTRDSVLGALLPPERTALSRAALAAIETGHPELDGGWAELAAELAEQCGDAARAAQLWFETGCRAIDRGALASAAVALERSRAIAAGDPRLATRAGEALVAALTLAGRTDQVFDIGEGVLSALEDDPEGATRASEVHLLLARAATRRTDWALAREHLAAALAGREDDVALRARTQVLAAEVALGELRPDAGHEHATEALALARTARLPEVQALALELLGRIAREVDLPRAEAAFRAAAEVADANDLMLRRISALHELGTLDVYRVGSPDRLLLARELALQIGDLALAAVAGYHAGIVHAMRFELEPAMHLVEQAREEAQRYRLGQLQAAATVVLGTASVLAGDDAAADALLGEALRLSDDPERRCLAHGLGWAVIALVNEDRDRALEQLDRAADAARTSGVARSPATGLWALTRVVAGSDDAPVVRAEGLHAHHNVVNAAYLGYARAVLAGRAGDGVAAAAAFDAADALVARCPYFRQLGRRLVAEPAVDDRWGDPVAWLRESDEFFTRIGRERVAGACRGLLRRAGAPVPRRRGDTPVPPELRALGLTGREVEVLALVREGLTNGEIADHLFLSRRTVEKHVERLLAKTGAANRTQLVALRT